MREAAFVKMNMKRWKEYEKLLEAPIRDPEKKSEIFIQLTDDLAFAQTQFPDSETARYLNYLGAGIHQQIYKNKREARSRLITFWTHELPLMLIGVRSQMLYSFIITVLALGIGVISTLKDQTFVRLILGDGYVNMTLENLRNGNPTGVYSNEDPVSMFLFIAFNNVRVSFMAFSLGVIASLGTVYLLVRNGVRLGSFFTLFYQHNLLQHSLMIVLLHGTLEVSAIIIAGAAGLRMGNSILFPGTFTRLDSFKKGALEGLKLVVGLIPIFLVAAYIESFITRHSAMPALGKLAIIGLSLLFIIFYFFVYPTWLSRVSEDRIEENP